MRTARPKPSPSASARPSDRIHDFCFHVRRCAATLGAHRLRRCGSGDPEVAVFGRQLSSGSSNTAFATHRGAGRSAAGASSTTPPKPNSFSVAREPGFRHCAKSSLCGRAVGQSRWCGIVVWAAHRGRKVTRGAGQTAFLEILAIRSGVDRCSSVVVTWPPANRVPVMENCGKGLLRSRVCWPCDQ